MSIAVLTADQLTLTPHAIAAYSRRAKVDCVRATDDLRFLYGLSKQVGIQVYSPTAVRGAVPKKGRNNPLEVAVMHADIVGVHWILFMRGKVLLTAHGPFWQGGQNPTELRRLLPEDLTMEGAAQQEAVLYREIEEEVAADVSLKVLRGMKKKAKAAYCEALAFYMAAKPGSSDRETGKAKMQALHTRLQELNQKITGA